MRKLLVEVASLLAFVPTLHKASNRALSVYFPIHYDAYEARFYEREFRELVKRHRNRFSDQDNAVLDRELPRVQAHMEVLRPAGCPGMAAFADEPKGVLELIRLVEEPEERLEIGPPLLTPIELELRKYPPALVVVVDKERADTFASVLDEMIPLRLLKGRQVKHLKSGGTKSSSLQRRAENRAMQNMESVVRLMEQEMRAVPYRRIFLAGPDEARAELEKVMAPALKKLVAGHLSASFDLGIGQLESHLRKQIIHAPAPSHL